MRNGIHSCIFRGIVQIVDGEEMMMTRGVEGG